MDINNETPTVQETLNSYVEHLFEEGTEELSVREAGAIIAAATVAEQVTMAVLKTLIMLQRLNLEEAATLNAQWGRRFDQSLVQTFPFFTQFYQTEEEAPENEEV